MQQEAFLVAEPPTCTEVCAFCTLGQFNFLVAVEDFFNKSYYVLLLNPGLGLREWYKW
jgi:hypothetical protein